MKISSILNQALKIKQGATFSQVKNLVHLSKKYQLENNELFLDARGKSEVKILNEKLFFKFISDITNIKIDSFEDIGRYLNSTSKKENILFSSNSKTKNIAPFNKIAIIKKKGELPKLYKKQDLSNLKIKKIVAIENSESFLDVDENMFNIEYFIYLGGNANSVVREFLEDKEILFFIDLDIISLNFYENFKCKNKSLFVPKNFEELLNKFGNSSLYQKQRRFLKSSYSREILDVIDLIKKFHKVLEQEII